MNILFISQKFPYPLNDGGNIRSFHLLKQLASKHSVTLLSNVKSPQEVDNCGELKALCAKILTFPQKTSSSLLLAKSILRSLFGDQPYFMYKNFSPELLAGILAEIGKGSYQAIHFNHIDTAQYIGYLPDNIFSVLDTHNILSLIVQRLWEQETNLVKKKFIHNQWQKTLKAEKHFCRRMSCCLVCSENDAKELATLAPGAKIQVIPNGVEPERPTLSQATDEPSLVFIGAMDYLPNHQGILYFCEKVLPQIEQEIPGIKLHVIGRNPTPEVRQLAYEQNITILDKVDDIYSVLCANQILVVPLMIGGGTRLKILDAMSFKLPVVSTSIGAEGLGATHDENILIADEPQDMARQIIRLYKDKSLREKLVSSAHKLIRQKYDWKIIGEQLLRVYAGLG